jgi:hypothetical protein
MTKVLLDGLRVWVDVKFNSCSINSLGTPDMSVDFYAKMSLFSWRNFMSVSSYLGSRLFPT